MAILVALRCCSSTPMACGYAPARSERLEQAVVTAGSQVSMIAAIILCASIIIGVLAITGLGVKITSLILSASGGMLWPSLLLTALACLVLGMEVPTTAAYVICVSVAGPALTEAGARRCRRICSCSGSRCCRRSRRRSAAQSSLPPAWSARTG
jgi:TRAP-type uncharacterized transport system fused permease subunit